jgi:hypothetical protein
MEFPQKLFMVKIIIVFFYPITVCWKPFPFDQILDPLSFLIALTAHTLLHLIFYLVYILYDIAFQFMFIWNYSIEIWWFQN